LRSIDLNADLATSVNIACGFNAGDPETVATCLSVLGVIVTRGYESQ
jgi:lactam utilization protein B